MPHKLMQVQVGTNRNDPQQTLVRLAFGSSLLMARPDRPFTFAVRPGQTARQIGLALMAMAKDLVALDPEEPQPEEQTDQSGPATIEAANEPLPS